MLWIAAWHAAGIHGTCMNKSSGADSGWNILARPFGNQK